MKINTPHVGAGLRPAPTSRTSALRLLILMMFLAGCTAVTTPQAVTPTATTAATTLVPTLAATLTLPPTPAPATAVPTTPPMQTLAVAPAWADAAQGGIDSTRWQIAITDDPATALADGTAVAALIANGDGQLVWQETIALAVPWTTAWETISLADAQAIQANGHALATLLPWAELTPDQKALRVDGRTPADPAYPLQNRLTLQAAPGTDTTALAAALTAHLDTDPVVQLTAVGDIMLDRALGYAISQGSVDFPLALMANELQQGDITIGNLESALGDVGEPVAKSYTFRAPPEAAVSLANAGFDIVSLANNHGMDFGSATLQQAIDLLQAQGIAPIGGGENARAARTPHIMSVNGLTIAFLAYLHVPIESSGFNTETWTATDTTPGLAWADPNIVAADVTAVAAQTDLVVVMLHSGYEYVAAPSPPQIAAAHAAIDAGADVVIGHHAHILQGIEYYNGGVILYGLGNFAFEIDGPPETAVYHIWLDADGVREVEIVPAVIQFGGQPRPAEPWEADAIRQTVYALTNALR